jgi:hypothetical protein
LGEIGINRGAEWVRNCQGKAEKNRYNILQKGGEKSFAVNRVDPTCGCRSYIAWPLRKEKRTASILRKDKRKSKWPLHKDIRRSAWSLRKNLRRTAWPLHKDEGRSAWYLHKDEGRSEWPLHKGEGRSA